ncbi:MAG: DUF2971 domain-containing protein [Tateyamaria sp.]|uniref:DUF2971 domain-containing protein n=1 Tax=Tateyamaria sp. TaxID=1929288 RepID=UPI00329AAC72
MDDLNDPFEFRNFNFPSEVSREIWEKTRAHLFSDNGIICFCRDWSNPVIWSHYADNHRGLALGFDIPKSHVLPVEYRKVRKRLPELSKLPSSKLMPLVQGALTTKFKHWEYENEVRMFSNADEKCMNTGLFFKSFDKGLVLREIIIGPLSGVTSQEIAEHIDLTLVKIVTSRLAFTKYSVVRQ